MGTNGRVGGAFYTLLLALEFSRQLAINVFALITALTMYGAVLNIGIHNTYVYGSQAHV